MLIVGLKMMRAIKIKLFILVCGLLPCFSCLALSWPDKFDWQIYKSTRTHLPGVDWRLYKAQLIQESSLNAFAVSKAGAEGVAQFMPGTWRDVSVALGVEGSPFDPHLAIPAGAFYMSQLKYKWRWPRPDVDRYNLALASYNAGFGNVLRAQKRCDNAVLYAEIVACLEQVTGVHSVETISYVRRIRAIHQILRDKNND